MNKFLKFNVSMCFSLLVMLTITACGSTRAVTPGTAESKIESTTESVPATEGAYGLDPNRLLDLMLYHMISDVQMASTLEGEESVVTMSADKIVITTENQAITLNADVQIVEKDIEACNGVIHIINKILAKPNEAGNSATAVPETEVAQNPTAVPCAEGQSIADILRSRSDLSGFTASLESVGLMDMLDKDGSYTVFAPPDGVFVLPTAEPVASGTTTPTGEANNKITICHNTGSKTNPYVLISVSTNGLNGHDSHPGDLIPAPGEGCPVPTP